MVHASDDVNENETPPPEPVSEVRLQLESPSSDSPPDQSTTHDSPRSILASSLRAHTTRLRIAKVRAEFEQTLLTLLTLNVIYMYYIDHKLLVLVIRACQVIRLLHFPYASHTSQRGTAVLLLVSNLPVLLIHKMLFTGPGGVRANIGQMLFINFVGPEPKSLSKILTVDCIIIVLQAMLLQCKWELDSSAFQLLSALPVPISEELVQVRQDDPDDPDDSSSSATT